MSIVLHDVDDEGVVRRDCGDPGPQFSSKANEIASLRSQRQKGGRKEREHDGWQAQTPFGPETASDGQMGSREARDRARKKSWRRGL